MKNNISTIALAVGGLVALFAVLTIWSPGGLGHSVPGGKSQLAAVISANLSSAANFAILAGSAVVDTNLSVIIGDVGLSPASGSFNGVSCAEVAGTIYSTDAAGPVPCAVQNASLLTQAKNDLTAAYTEAANETPATTLAGSDNQLGGKILTPGIYTFSGAATANLIGTLTLDGGGDPNAVFVFQTASSFVTDSASVVDIINGTQACNVFWQVGSSATFGTGTTFIGNVMADQAITDAGGSTFVGRLLARIAAVTLNNTHVTVPACNTSATLHVIKLVVNGSGSSADPSAFNVHVKSGGADVAGSPAPGIGGLGTLYSLSGGTYTISEDSSVSYTQSFTGDCDANGNVTLTVGVPKICTIINTNIPVPGASGNVSGGSGMVVPLIGILKVPSPLALPAGPGPVTYNYTVWNVGGQIALTGVTVTDDKCTPVTLLSGDTNSNGKLDISESWKYSCTTTLSTTTTNTAIATGYSDDAFHTPAIATAIATVVVGAQLPPPLINIVKVPSRLTPFPFGGGDVTYTYTVTNPGVVAMHDVSVTDDKCGPVSRTSGDINNNNLLNLNETWTYTCQTHIQTSTRNIATARGSANNFIALGYAFANVFVSSPGLPQTGFPPLGETQ